MNWRNLELELELDSEIFNRKIDLEIERAKVKQKKSNLDVYGVWHAERALYKHRGYDPSRVIKMSTKYERIRVPAVLHRGKCDGKSRVPERVAGIPRPYLMVCARSGSREQDRR